MGILQRVSLYPQERFDVPDARAIEAFAANDWAYFLKGILTTKSKVISGFTITNYPNIFTVPGVRLSQNDVAILHSEATTQAQGFYVSSGTEADYVLVLSSNSSSLTTNFIEVDFQVATGSNDTRAFWDSGANSGAGAEYTDTVDTVINLSLSIDVNISGFSTGKIPLYKIITNPDGTVNSVTDCRPMMFRLGSGGTSPSATSTATYSNSPDSSHARFETPLTAHAATLINNPAQGGDKNIKDLKTWMDWVMDNIREIKQTPYWYMKPQGSIAQSYMNAAMTMLQGGTYTHLSGSTGNLQMTSGSVIVRMGLNNSSAQPFSDFNLNTNDTLFVLLSNDGSSVAYMAGQDTANPIKPKAASALTFNSITVPTGGNYITSGGNLLIRGMSFSYTAYAPSTGLFTGVNIDPTGLCQVGDIVYQDNNGAVGYYQQAAAGNLPGLISSISEGAERVFWLAHFDGVQTIFIRDSELIPGTSAQAGELGSNQLYQYIGSTGPSDAAPIYNVNSIPNGTDLTTAIKDAYKIIETPIYDEKVNGTLGVLGSSTFTPAYSPTGSNTTLAFGASGGYQSVGFQMTFSSPTQITSGQFQFLKAGSPVGHLVVNIYNATLGSTTPGSLVVSSTALAVSSIGSGLSMVTVPFPSTTLSAGTYLISLACDSAYFALPPSFADYVGLYSTGCTGSPDQEAITYNGSSWSNQTFVPNFSLSIGTMGYLGWTASTVVYLPTNSKTSLSGAYSMGTDELQVFENGVMLQKGYDYDETTSSSITLLRDVYSGSFLRFRIASVGGAGASAGTGTAGLSLQGAYANGNTITVASGSPVIINGPSGQKLLHVAGNVAIDGLLDPTGLQLSAQATSPIPSGQMGFWIDSATNNVVFTRQDGTTLPVGTILEGLQGNTPNFTRLMTNTSGATIAAGTPVYLTGTDQIAMAHADDTNASRFIGFTAATVANNATVNVILAGVAPGVMAASGLPTNTRIWLTSTPGTFSAYAPTTSGSYQIQLGLVCGNDLIMQVQDFGQIA